MTLALTFDVGTTGVKTCLFRITDTIEEIASRSEGYAISVLPGGGVEQEQSDWWAAMCSTTRTLFEQFPEYRTRIDGISFCSQMQSLVLVDQSGTALRPAMSYMDQRATDVMHRIGGPGPRIAGLNPALLLRAAYITGAAPASAKDPVWKYLWVKENEPEIFSQVHKWLDVKDSLVSYMTGECAMSQDSAFATLLYDVRSKTPRFSPWMLDRLGVDPAHMPRIVKSTDIVGTLLPHRAAELGLEPGIPVMSGGGDSSLIGVGSGATEYGDTHVYIGTSGWVSTVTDRVHVDTQSMMAALVGAIPDKFNYFAELETAGKCLEWVKDHLALDEINVYLSQEHVANSDMSEYESLYDYLSEVIATAEPGAGGVIFTPWLHGNRCPFEDPHARGSFQGIGLNTGKTELLRAVVEGVCFHLRWFIETAQKRVPASQRVRFSGGGALSPVTSQILADILGRPVDVVDHPQDVGTVGAALVVAAGLEPMMDLNDAARLVPVVRSYEPRPEHRDIYDALYDVFTDIYPAQRKILKKLASIRRS